ncbi:MAG: hypothetical protein PHE50_04725 [Dehalococcoidales bacterium]|nr:hypothetical protein [Dehalococcoidales bacterium]
MLNTTVQKVLKEEKGITGLETAIILIAFVVVAAVFAYTVLSSGLFATQKAGESVYNSLSETQGTLQVKGNVTGYRGSGADIGNTMGKIEVTISKVFVDGESVDLTAPYTYDGTTLAASGNDSSTVISYTDGNTIISDCAWSIAWIGKNNNNDILEQSEQAVITIWLHPYDAGNNPAWTFGGADFLGTNLLEANQTFTLEIKAPHGAVLPIERTTPAYLDPVTDLR